jgi:hypothetical protein
MDFSDFVVYGLATWRLASMVVREDGPWGMFMELRELAGIEHDDGEIFIIPDEFFANLLSCVWCASMWVGFFWLVFWMAWPWMAIRVAIMFGFSAVAILVDERLSSSPQRHREHKDF